MHETEHSKPVYWDNREGWDGEGGGRGVQDGDTCTPMADSCQCMAKPLQYCKIISLQLNKLIKRFYWPRKTFTEIGKMFQKTKK